MPAPDTADLDGDGDVAEALPEGANGVARYWPGADIGAHEAPPLESPSLVVTTLADVQDDNDGVISLRDAIASATSGVLSGTITFDAELFGVDGGIHLNGTKLRIAADMVIDGDIDGDGFADLTLDVGGLSRVLHVVGAEVDLIGLVVQGGAAEHDGGILIEDAAQVSLSGVLIAETKQSAASILLSGGNLLWDAPLGDIGAAAQAPSGAMILMADRPDLRLADVFASIDPASGGGEYFVELGVYVGVPLAPRFANPAIDADGPPVLGDLGAVAADLSGTAAQFDGAALLHMGRDDVLLVTDATSAAQFSHDADLLSFDADGDGRAEAPPWLGFAPDLALSFDAGPDGVKISLVPARTAVGEVVQLTVGTPWQTLTFANDYIDPVVFALAPSLNKVEAAATRFRNVSATGAEIRLQETKKIIDPVTELQIFNPGDLIDEIVSLLVLEKGVHTLEDGTIIQVGDLSTSKLYVKGFETVAFAENFDTAPSIFSQVQTFDGTDFIISRQRNPTTDGFQLSMQEEQADNLNHAVEDAGWFAIEHGGGSLSDMDWQAGSSAWNVNGKLTNAAFAEAPLVVAALASDFGTDTASPWLGPTTATGFKAMALEDQSFDLETNHSYEIVDWMTFSAAGAIYAAPEPAALPFAVAGPETRVAESGMASAGDQAVTVSFGGRFDNPVVIASLISAHDADAAVARVSKLSVTGFDLMVQETGDQDGSHAAEDVSWIVVEAGSWVLADGTVIQAGLATFNGTDAAATGIGGLTATGFDICVEEDRTHDAETFHAAETFHWIAFNGAVDVWGDALA